MDKTSQFFRNYDYADSSSGPGTGFYGDMSKQKSIKDFLKKKRKLRRKFIKRIAQNQFKLDDTLTSLPAQESVYTNSIPLGGMSDISNNHQPRIDEAKGLSGVLMNGQRDYSQDRPVGEKVLDEFISPQEPHLYGLNRELDIEESEQQYFPSKQKYNITDLKQETFKDIKPYP